MIKWYDHIITIQIYWKALQKSLNPKRQCTKILNELTNYLRPFRTPVSHIQSPYLADYVHYSTFCSLQVYHRPAGAPGGDPPPSPGPHIGPHNHHHAHRLPLPPEADSEPAPAPQRSLHVQEHVVSSTAAAPSALSKANLIKDLSPRCPRPNTTEESVLPWTDSLTEICV